MFRDRDIILLAAGAVAGIATLALPFSLITRAVMAAITLGVFMVLALARFGPDRVPLEQFIMRRIRYARSTRRYVYQRASIEPPPVEAQPPQPVPQPVAKQPVRTPTPPRARPVVFAFEEVGVEPVLTAAMAVLAAYLTYWLYTGGWREFDVLHQMMIR